jgi:hypothetical protein
MSSGDDTDTGEGSGSGAAGLAEKAKKMANEIMAAADTAAAIRAILFMFQLGAGRYFTAM